MTQTKKHFVTAGLSMLMTTAGLAMSPFAAAGSYVTPYQDSATVTSVTPRIRYEQVAVPRQQCWSEPVADIVQPPTDHLTGVTGQTVIGGLLGAAIGNQIGDGRGRDAATVAGGLIGASLGANRANRQNFSRATTRVRHEQRCRTVNDYRTEQRVDGYDVSYHYRGRSYQTVLPYHPGNTLPVSVNVAPLTTTSHNQSHYSGYSSNSRYPKYRPAPRY